MESTRRDGARPERPAAQLGSTAAGRGDGKPARLGRISVGGPAASRLSGSTPQASSHTRPVESRRVEPTSAKPSTPTATAKAPAASGTASAVVETEPATPAAAPTPEPAEPPTRGQELPQLVLPRPGTRSWNADDLDVPAFLRRQMD